jgi:ABC-type lipoprotein export system ATPase subunit
MIEIKNVNKYFNRHKKNELHVINDTSLKLEKGLVSLLGPSGSGKSTLLNTVGGLDKVNSGEIYINSKRITKTMDHKRDEIRALDIGYIFQDYLLLDDLTVFENKGRR